MHQQWTTEDLHPALRHFFICPLAGGSGIDMNHDVVVIAHNGIGTQINGEHRAQEFDSVDDPLAAVFKIKTGERISAAQIGAPYTS